MEVNEVSSTTSGKKKRKFLNKECNVKTVKVSVESDDKHLDHHTHKVFKTSSSNQKSDIKTVQSINQQKKHFKLVKKVKDKAHNHFKENGSCTTIAVSSDQIDGPISQERNKKFHGTNGSGLIKKNALKESAKEQNVNSENDILLARIERKGVCSNWKTFKEVVKKDERVNGQDTKHTTKKKIHSKSMKPNKVISLHSAPNSRENVKFSVETNLDKKHANYKSQKIISNGINGDLKSVNATHNLKQLKKHHYGNFPNGNQCITAGSGKGVHQDSEGNTPHKNSKRLTKEIALDCEMVGTEDNSDMVARVSLVNRFGECVYDKYVAPTEKVLDYRTWVSGIRPENLKNAEDFKQVQKEVAEILQGRLLVGHAVRNDLKVLFLSHPRRYTRDTQRFKLFRELTKNKRPSLKKLAKTILNISIQEGEHSSVEDAKAAMQLYMLYQKKWEKLLRKSKKRITTTSTVVPTE